MLIVCTSLGGDILGGLTVASMLIPQSVSYASSLAKLSPVTGLVSPSRMFRSSKPLTPHPVLRSGSGYCIRLIRHITSIERCARSGVVLASRTGRERCPSFRSSWTPYRPGRHRTGCIYYHYIPGIHCRAHRRPLCADYQTRSALSASCWESFDLVSWMLCLVVPFCVVL